VRQGCDVRADPLQVNDLLRGGDKEPIGCDLEANDCLRILIRYTKDICGLVKVAVAGTDALAGHRLGIRQGISPRC